LWSGLAARSSCLLVLAEWSSCLLVLAEWSSCLLVLAEWSSCLLVLAQWSLTSATDWASVLRPCCRPRTAHAG
jgi:hypothetical protein